MPDRGDNNYPIVEQIQLPLDVLKTGIVQAGGKKSGNKGAVGATPKKTGGVESAAASFVVAESGLESAACGSASTEATLVESTNFENTGINCSASQGELLLDVSISRRAASEHCWGPIPSEARDGQQAERAPGLESEATSVGSVSAESTSVQSVEFTSVEFTSVESASNSVVVIRDHALESGRPGSAGILPALPSQSAENDLTINTPLRAQSLLDESTSAKSSPIEPAPSNSIDPPLADSVVAKSQADTPTEESEPSPNYLSLLKEKDSGGIEILVQMAQRGELDPKNIDIIDATDRFLQAIAAAPRENLRQSGKIIFHASVLLRMKAEALLISKIEELDIGGGDDFIDFDDDGSPLIYDSNDEAVGRQITLADLQRALVRRSKQKQTRQRRVTLEQLIESLREAENYEKKRLERKERERDTKPVIQMDGYHAMEDMEDILDLAHDEDIEDVILRVEQLLIKTMEEVFRLSLAQLIAMLNGKGDWVDAFLAVLFLSNSGKLNLEQDVFYGPLYLARGTRESLETTGAEGVSAAESDRQTSLNLIQGESGGRSKAESETTTNEEQGSSPIPLRKKERAKRAAKSVKRSRSKTAPTDQPAGEDDDLLSVSAEADPDSGKSISNTDANMPETDIGIPDTIPYIAQIETTIDLNISKPDTYANDLSFIPDPINDSMLVDPKPEPGV